MFIYRLFIKIYSRVYAAYSWCYCGSNRCKTFY